MRSELLLLAPLLLGGCAADQFYEAALGYESTRPLAALEYYQACFEVEPNHEQARPRFDGQDFYARFVASAEALEASGDWVSALSVYDQLVDVDLLVRGSGGPAAPVDLIGKRARAIQRASRQKLAEGDELRAAGDAKAASKAYRAALAYDPRSAQARARYQEERAKATRRVAVLPFSCDDATFEPLARQLSDRMVARAIAGQPEFLQFVDRNHLDDLLDEHDLNASGIVDPSTVAETGKLLGLHAVVYGTLRFERSDTGWIAEPGEDTITLRHDDGKGGHYDEPVSATWVVHTRQTRARALAGYQVIDVETGQILAAKAEEAQEVGDTVRWAEHTGGRAEALPEDVRVLMNAEVREPADPTDMTTQLVAPLSDRLAQALLRQFR